MAVQYTRSVITNFPFDPSGPGVGMSQVTPSDTDDIANVPARSLLVIGAGAVCAVGYDGEEFTVTLPANSILPVAVMRVKASGTVATPIYAIW